MADSRCGYCNASTPLAYINLKERDENGVPKLMCGECRKTIEN